MTHILGKVQTQPDGAALKSERTDGNDMKLGGTIFR